MKVGDKVPVTIAGQTVANASVRELGDGTVTLVVPATLVVMATRTEISTPEPVQQETETLITGVERTSGEPVESAAVGGETIATNENRETTQETPTVETTEVSGATESTAGTSPDAGPNEGTSSPDDGTATTGGGNEE